MVKEQGFSGCPHSYPPFPPEDPQADTSVSFLPHLEAKIRQTHSLAHLLTKYAEQLLQEYVSENGGWGVKGLGIGEAQVTEVLHHPFA